MFTKNQTFPTGCCDCCRSEDKFSSAIRMNFFTVNVKVKHCQRSCGYLISGGVQGQIGGDFEQPCLVKRCRRVRIRWSMAEELELNDLLDPFQPKPFYRSLTVRKALSQKEASVSVSQVLIALPGIIIVVLLAVCPSGRGCHFEVRQSQHVFCPKKCDEPVWLSVRGCVLLLHKCNRDKMTVL